MMQEYMRIRKKAYQNIGHTALHITKKAYKWPQWRIQEFGKGGTRGGLGACPSGVQGQRPGGGSGGEAPLKLKGFL